jgi:hypothetical protein
MSNSRTVGRRTAQRADEPVGRSLPGKVGDAVQALIYVEYDGSGHTLTSCVEALWPYRPNRVGVASTGFAVDRVRHVWR